MPLSCPFAGRYADPIKHTVDARIGTYWHDNAFNHATGPQSGGNPADCRPTDMEFARQPHPIGANQFRVCVHPAFKRLQEKLVNFKRQFGRSSPWIARCSMFLHNSTPAAFNPATNLPSPTIISHAVRHILQYVTYPADTTEFYFVLARTWTISLITPRVVCAVLAHTTLFVTPIKPLVR